MELTYPHGFPAKYRDAVGQKQATAEYQYRVAMAAPAADRRRLAYEYVSALVLEFGRQACLAAREGAISSYTIDKYVADFERRANVHAYYHLGLGVLWPRWEDLRDWVDLHRSAGWLEHLQERAAAGDVLRAPATEAGAPSSPEEVSTSRAPEDRRLLVDRFIERVLAERGVTITRKDVWQVAGYTEATEFERWQRHHAGYPDGCGADVRFRKVLNLTPVEFISRLRRDAGSN
jgi:hypothetical protein